MANKNELENNKTDLIASLAKSAVGGLPLAGPLLAELVGTVIPNQRIDRLTKYVIELEEKVSKIPIEKLDSMKNNEEFIDLVEEGFFQASRAITDERRKYIASIVSNGVTDESIELQEFKYLLKILEQINDIEVIWLKFYYDSSMGGDEDFRNMHENVLSPIYVKADSDQELSLNRSAIQESYKEHLDRLKLIKRNFKFDKSKGIPEFDKSGEPKIKNSKITKLGKLLLKEMGILDEK